MKKNFSTVHTFPLLVPANLEGTLYNGIINIHDEEFSFQIRTLGTNESTLSDAKIYGSPELKELILGQEEVIQQKLDLSSDIPNFLIDLKDLLERVYSIKRLSTKATSVELPSPTYYSAILAEFDAIGWDNVQRMDFNMHEFEIHISDRSSRIHVLQMHLPPTYPINPPNITSSLPPTFSAPNPKQPLHQLIAEYARAIDDFVDLWDCLDELDEHTWVLEPDHPRRGDVLRRIAVGNYCSLQIIVNPSKPRNLPQLHLFGPESHLEPLRASIAQNLHLWDPQRTLYQNLLTLLTPSSSSKPFAFPPRVTTGSTGDTNMECGICYAYRTREEIPDQICMGGCGRSFHRECLVGWLRFVPSTRQSFNMLFGECPYCSETISTSVGDM